MHHTIIQRHCVSVAILLLCASAAQAQSTQQVVHPPKVLLWMDVSTSGMAGMPEIDIPGLGGLMGGLMGAMGGNPNAKTSGKEYYGAARSFHMMPPRILDVALWNGLKPGVEAAQAIPAGMKLGDKLPLLPILAEKVVTAEPRPEKEYEGTYERPKGRLLFYWGCSATVRPGQPRIIDLGKLSADSAQAFGSAFGGKYAPDRGAKVREGYDVYPNERDQRSLPRGASLVGEHRVMGDSVPESFKFNLGPTHDVMPSIELQSRGSLKETVALSWAPVTNAKAYFLNAMGASGDDMVFWSSSDLPDTGMGLFDYLANATIDKWIKEKVLLASSVTQCDVPKGIYGGQEDGASSRGREGGGAMLRMIAYGGEHGFVYPPRPTDPKVPWDQEWSVRLRVKSQTMAMLGQEIAPERKAKTSESAEKKDPAAEPADNNPLSNLPNPASLLKGLFGR
jgi:hypothetical protein